MVAYEEHVVFPAPRDALWKLLDAHLDDSKIASIHPLITSQKTVSRNGPEILVDRVIDVRRRALKSRWKITYGRPDHARWEILESEGPWAPGSHIDVIYSDAPGGTLVTARGDVTISVLPFFMSQVKQVNKAMDFVHDEDVAFVRR